MSGLVLRLLASVREEWIGVPLASQLSYYSAVSAAFASDRRHNSHQRDYFNLAMPDARQG